MMVAKADPLPKQIVNERNWPVNIRNITFGNIQCIGENAIAIIGENHNIENVFINGLTMKLKPSKNLSLKGNVIDMSPLPQTPTIPVDGQKYWLIVKDVGNVSISNYHIDKFEGEELKEHCENALVQLAGK